MSDDTGLPRDPQDPSGAAEPAHPDSGPARPEAEVPVTEVPAAETPDADAWAQACAEDLAAEQARRRRSGAEPPGSAAEELRRLMDAVAGKLSDLSGAAGAGAPLFGAAAQQMIRQARAAVEPVVERNPEVFDHLAAAGSELLAAYRSAAQQQESRWTRGPDDGGEYETGKSETGGTGRTGADGKAAGDGRDGRDGRGDEPGPGEHIDLD
ncbi:DUF5304 domain-containing protein [Streptomyces sp. NPDC058045]|uniref:DUF5304 domain-containing protein n=1 Tax=Streptomyces sp. NPDC058045 TaxID=3346311 RepID=UPI0036ECE95A